LLAGRGLLTKLTQLLSYTSPISEALERVQQILPFSLYAGGPARWSNLRLPVDPLLGSSSSQTLPSLPLLLGPQASLVARTAFPAVVVTEGIPPVSLKVIERVRWWEYVDLATLLASQDTNDDAHPHGDTEHYGQKSSSRSKGKYPHIHDIMTWLTAYSCFMAVVLAAAGTSKDEAAGLAAHQHVILQLHNDLGGNRWMKYDTEFREWAAAKGIRVWGELNLAIYGPCLPQVQQVKALPSLPDVVMQAFNKKSTPICFQWNKGHCV